MLGEHVRNIRKKRGITLKELAEKTGLSIGYILSLIHIWPGPDGYRHGHRDVQPADRAYLQRYL